MKKFLLSGSLCLLLILSCNSKAPAIDEKLNDITKENAALKEQNEQYKNKIAELESELKGTVAADKDIDEEQYWKIYEKIDMFAYRKNILLHELNKKKFTEYENIANSIEYTGYPLYGNQLSDIEYLSLLKKILYLKNGISFGDKDVDDEYKIIYPWYEPTENYNLSDNEKKLLEQLNFYLAPDSEELPFNTLENNLLGIWQIDSFDIYASYVYSIRFEENNKFKITKNEMDNTERFQYLSGTYEIQNHSLVFHVKKICYQQGGEYFLADNDGLINHFVGGNKEEKDLTNMILSYPVLSYEKTKCYNREYMRLKLFTDNVHYFYKVR
ncbi:MAG: hypothetical protein J6W46_05165 [Spirochaetaceae bacterium]|nr:hypothetical protein [Spirochaetaceae bacterium]MBP5793017.1 hypothetical protein [Spirochaetaceae bacterium]